MSKKSPSEIQIQHRETFPDICINVFKPCGTNNFHLQFWSSSPRCIFYWISWKFSFPQQSGNEKLVLVSRQQKRINWVKSWRNLPNVLIDQRARSLTWFKMIVIAIFVHQLNSYRYKKNQIFDLQETLERFCNVLPANSFTTTLLFILHSVLFYNQSMSTKKQNFSLCKLYSFYEETPEEFLDETDVNNHFYHNSFDISQCHHRRVRVSRGSNKKSFAIKLFQFCDLKTQERYIL